MRRYKHAFVTRLGLAAIGAIAAECEEMRNRQPTEVLVGCIYENRGNGSDTQCAKSAVGMAAAAAV